MVLAPAVSVIIEKSVPDPESVPQEKTPVSDQRSLDVDAVSQSARDAP